MYSKDMKLKTYFRQQNEKVRWSTNILQIFKMAAQNFKITIKRLRLPITSLHHEQYSHFHLKIEYCNV